MTGLDLGGRRVAVWCVVGVLVGVAVACTGAVDTASSDHVVLDDLELLRTRFNEDVGKVRAVFLASPT